MEAIDREVTIWEYARTNREKLEMVMQDIDDLKSNVRRGVNLLSMILITLVSSLVTGIITLFIG